MKNLSIAVFDERLPEDVKGAFAFNQDKETFNIILNAELSDSEQREVFLQECIEVWEDAIQRKNILEVERITHEMMKVFQVGPLMASPA